MTVYTVQKSNLLRKALRGNSIFSAISGLIMIVDAGMLANFMGVESTLPFYVVGVGLLLHAVNLYLNTRNERVSVGFGWFAIIGDIAWVLATAFILLTDAFGITSGGKWLLFIVADVVLTFALVQYIGVRRLS